MSQIRDPSARDPSAQDPGAWCAAVQAKLMAALDAAWAVIDVGADPAAVALAHAKARACGQLAATARKIATMVPATSPAKARRQPVIPDDLLARLEAAATRALIPEVAEPDTKPPAAQAVAMRAALRKLGRGSR
jgi:hypothetical protein